MDHVQQDIEVMGQEVDAHGPLVQTVHVILGFPVKTQLEGSDVDHALLV